LPSAPQFSLPLRSTTSSSLTLNHYRLEERRKAKGAAYYERKKLAQRQVSESKKNANVDKKTAEALTAFGY
jgi:hypothetical protein